MVYYENWKKSINDNGNGNGTTIIIPSLPQWADSTIDIIDHGDLHNSSLLSSLSTTRNRYLKNGYVFNQASAVIRRGYRKYFDENNIIVLDFHDDEKPMSIRFFCDRMPGSKRACDRAKKAAAKRPKILNPSTQNLEYLRLVVTAAQAQHNNKGILNNNLNNSKKEEKDKKGERRLYKKYTSSLKEVAKKAQHYQEKIPRRKFLDLSHHCDQDFFDLMLNITINEQKELGPYMVTDGSNSTGTSTKSSTADADEAEAIEVDVRVGFESYVQKKGRKKYCTLNVDEILKEEDWKFFFFSMKCSVA